MVIDNVKKSFPDKSEEEQKKIIKKFYKYFTELLAESVKNLTISEKNLRNRIIVENPELMEELYKEKKHVLLLSSHFYNWEMLITAQSLIFKQQAIGIGTPLSNKFWDKKINDRRERFGMKVVNSNNYKTVLKAYKKENIPTATLILGDQSPGKDENCYWTTFLNQQTAFFFGAEVLANQMDATVVYGVLKREKRGYYKLLLKEITQQPLIQGYGEITKKYIQLLEKDINTNLYAWLWSHKRWKKQIPENLNQIQKEHKERFQAKFRNDKVS